MQLQYSKDQECFMSSSFRYQHFEIVLFIHTTHISETDPLQKVSTEELS